MTCGAVGEGVREVGVQLHHRGAKRDGRQQAPLGPKLPRQLDLPRCNRTQTPWPPNLFPMSLALRWSHWSRMKALTCCSAMAQHGCLVGSGHSSWQTQCLPDTSRTCGERATWFCTSNTLTPQTERIPRNEPAIGQPEAEWGGGWDEGLGGLGVEGVDHTCRAREQPGPGTANAWSRDQLQSVDTSVNTGDERKIQCARDTKE